MIILHISKTSNDNRSNNFIVAVTVLATVLVLAPAAVALLYHSPSLAAASSNQSKKTSANTTGVGKVGNVKQLAKVAGNNSQIIANSTKIGTGKTFQAFGKEHKVTAPTPKSIKALPVHPQLARNMSSSTSGGGSNGSVTNKTSSNSTSTGSSINSTKK